MEFKVKKISHKRTNSKQQNIISSTSTSAIKHSETNSSLAKNLNVYPPIKSNIQRPSSKSPKIKEQFSVTMSSTSGKKLIGVLDKDNDYLTIKEQNMKLILEKNTLKSENQRLEKDLASKEKIIQELINYNPLQNNYSSIDQYNSTVIKTKEMFMVDKLKRQFKDLQTYSKQKEEELDKLKKSGKVTKITELNHEIIVLNSELTRLREANNRLSKNNHILLSKLQEQNDLMKGIKMKSAVDEQNVNDLKQSINVNTLKMERDCLEIENTENRKKLEEYEKEYEALNKKITELSEKKKAQIMTEHKNEDLFFKKKSQRLSQENVEVYNIIQMRQKCNTCGYKDDKIYSADYYPILIFDKNRQDSTLSLEKIEEIGYLLQKMFEAQGFDLNQKQLEAYLFDGLDFSSPQFQENFTEIIVNSVRM